MLSKTAGVLKCDMDHRRESSRISKSVKADRALLIYIAWQLGVAPNQHIGGKFELTYSAVGKRVSVLKKLFNEDKRLEIKYRYIKSQTRFDTVFSNLNKTDLLGLMKLTEYLFGSR